MNCNVLLPRTVNCKLQCTFTENCVKCKLQCTFTVNCELWFAMYFYRELCCVQDNIMCTVRFTTVRFTPNNINIYMSHVEVHSSAKYKTPSLCTYTYCWQIMCSWTYPRHILLTDHVFMRFDLLGVLGDPDSATLTSRFWLQDVRLIFFLSSVGLEVTVTESGEQFLIDSKVVWTWGVKTEC
jgi:hypothetical protein